MQAKVCILQLRQVKSIYNGAIGEDDVIEFVSVRHADVFRLASARHRRARPAVAAGALHG
jgi:hypothetical protein